MAEEINKTYTSNSLYNDSTGVIAFAEQLKQELINWANYQHVTEELGQNRPDLQNELNNLFLSVYERFLTFLNDADASEEAINTWKEIENFLADYTDEKTLASIVAELNNKIESRLAVPLENTTGSSTTSTMTQKAITETINASKTFTTGEKVDNVGIDDEPTAGSKNLVESGSLKNIFDSIDAKDSYLLNSVKIFGEGDTATYVLPLSTTTNDNLFVTNIPANSLIAFKLSYDISTISENTRIIIRYNSTPAKRFIDTQNYDGLVRCNNKWIIPKNAINETITNIGIYVINGGVGNTVTVSYALIKDISIKDSFVDINNFFITNNISGIASLYNTPNTLSDVISVFPELLKRGGIQVKFINEENVYKFYHLTKNVWSSNIDDWKEIAYVPEPEPEYITIPDVYQLTNIDETLTDGHSYAEGKRFAIEDDQVVLYDATGWTVRKFVVGNSIVQYKGTAPQSTADILSIFNQNNILLYRSLALKSSPSIETDLETQLTEDRHMVSMVRTIIGENYVLLNTKLGDDYYVKTLKQKDLHLDKIVEDDSIKEECGKNILKPLVTTLQGCYIQSVVPTVTGNRNTPSSMDRAYLTFGVDLRLYVGKKIFLERKSCTPQNVSMRFISIWNTSGHKAFYANAASYIVEEGDCWAYISISTNNLALSDYGSFQPLMLETNDFATKVGVLVTDADSDAPEFEEYEEVYCLPENHNLIKDRQIITKKNLDDALEQFIPEEGYAHSVSILNSDRIAFIGDSYTESSFTPEGKAYINKLSLFSDYAFMNVAQSGDIYTGQLNKIRTHTEPYQTNYLKYLPKFTMLCCFTNDIKYMNMEQYLSCVENAIQFVRAAGSEPIVCTEYHISNYYLTGTQGLENLARKYNCKFINIANAVSTIRGSDYTPFWGGSHPGVRANAIESDNYEKYLEQLERPIRSIKFFRLRSGVSYSDLDDLIFNSNYERAKLFKEINVGHAALTNPAFVDNCTSASVTSIKDEYRKIGDGVDVSFTKVSLISFVLPLTSTTIGNALLKLSGTFNGKIYVRDISASPYPDVTIYQRFDIVSGQSVPSIDDVYSGTLGGTTQNFTVKGIVYGGGEGGSDLVLCTPRATGYNDNSGGTLTKVNGSGPASLDYSYTSPGYEGGVPEDTCGHWIEILDGSVSENGLPISQPVIKKALNYDRLDVLLINSGTTFNVNGVELQFNGELGKTRIGARNEKEIIIPNYYNTETELIAHPTFGEAGVLDTNWNVTPTKVYEDIQANKKTYPIDCVSKVNVSTENSIETSVTVSPGKYSLEIDARYFPPIYTDGSGEQITVDSFDYALLKVEIRDGGASEASANKSQSVMFEKVNTHWKLCQFELTYYISGTIKIIVSSNDKEIEVAKVSLKKKMY